MSPFQLSDPLQTKQNSFSLETLLDLSLLAVSHGDITCFYHFKVIEFDVLKLVGSCQVHRRRYQGLLLRIIPFIEFIPSTVSRSLEHRLGGEVAVHSTVAGLSRYSYPHRQEVQDFVLVF